MKRFAVSLLTLTACSVTTNPPASGPTPSPSPIVTLEQAQAAWCADSDTLRVITSSLPAVPPDAELAAKIYDAVHAIQADAELYHEAHADVVEGQLMILAQHLHALGDAIATPTFGGSSLHDASLAEFHAIGRMSNDLDALAGSC